MWSRCFIDFSVSVGVFVIGTESDLFLFSQRSSCSTFNFCESVWTWYWLYFLPYCFHHFHKSESQLSRNPIKFGHRDYGSKLTAPNLRGCSFLRAFVCGICKFYSLTFNLNNGFEGAVTFHTILKEHHYVFCSSLNLFRLRNIIWHLLVVFYFKLCDQDPFGRYTRATQSIASP